MSIHTDITADELASLTVSSSNNPNNNNNNRSAAASGSHPEGWSQMSIQHSQDHHPIVINYPNQPDYNNYSAPQQPQQQQQQSPHYQHRQHQQHQHQSSHYDSNGYSRNTRQVADTARTVTSDNQNDNTDPPSVAWSEDLNEINDNTNHHIIHYNNGVELDHIRNENLIGVNIHSPYIPNTVNNTFQHNQQYKSSHTVAQQQKQLNESRLNQFRNNVSANYNPIYTDIVKGTHDSGQPSVIVNSKLPPNKEYEFYFKKNEFRKDKLDSDNNSIDSTKSAAANKDNSININSVEHLVPRHAEDLSDPHLDKRRYDYCIRCDSYNPDPSYPTHQQYIIETIYDYLVSIFNSENVLLDPIGKYDKIHSYIQITADIETLELLAEKQQFQLKSAACDDYYVFDRMEKIYGNRYAHPNNSKCTYRRRNSLQAVKLAESNQLKAQLELFDKQYNTTTVHTNNNNNTGNNLSSASTGPGWSIESDDDLIKPIDLNPQHLTNDSLAPCYCDIFVPYQRLELIRILIEQALDEALKYIDLHPTRADHTSIQINPTNHHNHTVGAEELHTLGRGLREFKRRKVILDFFPLHRDPTPQFYLSRKSAVSRYAGFRNSWRTALSIFDRSDEMLNWYRDYFGEKIGLYFSFLHFYNSHLILLSIIGLGPAIWQYLGGGDNPLVIFYCIFLILWAAIFMKFWNRRNADIAFEWNMRNYTNNEKELSAFIYSAQSHPDSKDAVFGFYEPEGRWVEMEDYATKALDRVKDENILNFIPKSHRDVTGKLPMCLFNWYGGPSRDGLLARLQLNSIFTRELKQSVGSGIIFTLFGVVGIITVSLLILRLLLETNLKFGGSVIAGMVNAITIFLLDHAYKWFALQLTLWENHRTVTQFEDRLASKTFLFQFINGYFTLFYIAFFKPSYNNGRSIQILGVDDYCRDREGNKAETCMGELSNALLSILLTRLIISYILQRWLPQFRTRTKVGQRMFEYEVEIKKKKFEEDRAAAKEAAAIKQAQSNITSGNNHNRTGSIVGGIVNVGANIVGAVSDLKIQDLTKIVNLDAIPLVDPVQIWNSMDRLCAEYQADQPVYEVTEDVCGVFTDYNELAIGYGYVVMFAPAFPIAPIAMLIHNIIENGTDGHKILYTNQRARYYGARDIGRFWYILLTLTLMAVGTNIGIIVFTSGQLQVLLGTTTDLTSRLISSLILEHIMAVLVLIIFLNLADQRPSLRETLARNEKIQDIEQDYRKYCEVTQKRNEQIKNHNNNNHPNNQLPSINTDNTANNNNNNSVEEKYQSPNHNNNKKKITHQTQGQSSSAAAAQSNIAKNQNQNANRNQLSKSNNNNNKSNKSKALQITSDTRRIQPVTLHSMDNNTTNNTDNEEFDYIDSSNSTDICFPLTIHSISKLTDYIVSDCCINGPHVYRLIIGRSKSQQSQSQFQPNQPLQSNDMIEFTIRYVSGPLPHQFTGYLLTKSINSNKIAFTRTLSYVYQSYCGYGYTEYSSINQLKLLDAYNPINDSITFGLLIPNTDWIKSALNLPNLPLPNIPTIQQPQQQPQSNKSLLKMQLRHTMPTGRLPPILTSVDDTDEFGNRLRQEITVTGAIQRSNNNNTNSLTIPPPMPTAAQNRIRDSDFERRLNEAHLIAADRNRSNNSNRPHSNRSQSQRPNSADTDRANWRSPSELAIDSTLSARVPLSMSAADHSDWLRTYNEAERIKSSINHRQAAAEAELLRMGQSVYRHYHNNNNNNQYEPDPLITNYNNNNQNNNYYSPNNRPSSRNHNRSRSRSRTPNRSRSRQRRASTAAVDNGSSSSSSTPTPSPTRLRSILRNPFGPIPTAATATAAAAFAASTGRSRSRSRSRVRLGGSSNIDDRAINQIRPYSTATVAAVNNQSYSNNSIRPNTSLTRSYRDPFSSGGASRITGNRNASSNQFHFQSRDDFSIAF